MKKITISICLLLLIIALPISANAAQMLIPVGQVIGLKLDDGTVSIADFDDETGTPARTAGLQQGDRIISVDGKRVNSISDVHKALSDCGSKVCLKIQRGKKEKTVTVTPAQTKQGAQLGIYLKEGITGVGTVTFYDPQSGSFGALGHGVNTQNGKLLQMHEGTAYEASILSVKKGKAGTPGQLVGALDGAAELGTLQKNTHQGVFGKTDAAWEGATLPVCRPDEVTTGTATIRCTVNNGPVQEYSVEILKIYPTAGEKGRNLLLRVTDPDLLAATGGIVQGMSGSPIIQDGKLIGAVTHVLVNDPTMGYGIFIENMLDAAA